MFSSLIQECRSHHLLCSRARFRETRFKPRWNSHFHQADLRDGITRPPQQGVQRAKHTIISHDGIGPQFSQHPAHICAMSAWCIPPEPAWPVALGNLRVGTRAHPLQGCRTHERLRDSGSSCNCPSCLNKSPGCYDSSCLFFYFLQQQPILVEHSAARFNFYGKTTEALDYYY